MRILYGVVGEGMGHATRSRVILEHLTQSHDVHVVASGRAFDYLKARFSGVHRIFGYTLAYEDNAVHALKTVLENLQGAVHGAPANVLEYVQLARNFRPEAIITDFESWSYLFGRNHRLPILSIDNMQVINRCRHPPEIIQGHERDFELSRAIVKAKVPGASRYLITTFFDALVRKERTSLVPPILRPEILAARPDTGEHLLVYQTSTSAGDLPGALKASGLPCRIYGFRRDLTAPEIDGALTYQPFSEESFIEDLRTCRGVVGNGGFTLMSEAIYLHKPFLSAPVGGQFEQVLNARYLQQAGYGQHAETIDAPTLAGFIGRLPDFARALSSYQQDGNTATFGEVDAFLATLATLRA